MIVTPPPAIYDAVVAFVTATFDLTKKNIVRPFFPGGDFENFLYKDNDVVIDNPPFSIFTKIVKFYSEKKIPFFLFAPHLTFFSVLNYATCIVTDETITYHNGAKVSTSFVTNMYKDNYAFTTEPKLKKAINEADKENRNRNTKKIKKIHYPEHIISGAMLGKYANVSWKVRRESVTPIKKMDNYRIFGGGVLLSDNEVRNRNRLDVLLKKSKMEEIKNNYDKITYELSAREMEIVKGLL